MKYEDILMEIDGDGIQDYNQGEEAVREHIQIGNGVCRALVVEWLRAKMDNKDFFDKKGTIEEGLLSASRILEKAVDLQEEYRQVAQSRFVPDAATTNELQESGLEYEQKDVIANAQEGFTQDALGDEALKIAEKVLSAGSRFFILSVKGTSGGHSIGIHRPYRLIGKSSNAYLFDPNIGEYKVDGKANLRGLLVVLNRIGYSDSGIDLNKSYIMWSYTR